MDSPITPRNFSQSHSGKMYYAYSGKRGVGAEAGLNVNLFNIALSPGRDLFVKLFFGMNWQQLVDQYGGLIVTINDATVIEYTTMASTGGIANTAPPIIYQEFFLPRNAKLLIEGRSDDTDNERWAVMLGYPI